MQGVGVAHSLRHTTTGQCRCDGVNLSDQKSITMVKYIPLMHMIFARHRIRPAAPLMHLWNIKTIIYYLWLSKRLCFNDALPLTIAEFAESL